jgi:hypothetical protein
VKYILCFAVAFCALLPSRFSASAAIVINEIHYNPDVKTEPAEFIELYNTGPNAVNLGGWFFSEGINFTFPATNVAPGGFVVVAQNPAFIQTKFGVAGALGPFNTNGSSGLASRGEKITLRNAANQIQDEVDFSLGFPWPTVGDALVVGTGKSIELINPSLDNDLAGSWRVAGSGAGGIPIQNTTLLPAQSSWNYRKGTNAPSTPIADWRQPVFDDSSWTPGPLPIGYGETFIATPLADMNGLYTSVFLRKQFTVSNPAQFARLILEAQYDDGFKCWINGTLVVDGTANMTAGEVAFSGTAISALENLNFVTLNLNGNPGSLLNNGLNTIAIQAHNSGLANSSDFFFDARLIGQTGGSSGSGPSPGAINTVFATNAPPQIRQVEHNPEQPMGGVPVKITAKVTDPDGVSAVTLEYQIVNPGAYIELTDAAYTNAANWISLPMNDAGANGDSTAGDDTFTAEIPASVQTHRRLIRYRITVADTGARSVRVPYTDDPQPNFAYFVYNGVPGWSGAVQPGAGGANGTVVNYPSNVMGRMPTIHLIGKSNMVATATWFSRYTGDAYQWSGALIYDGKVLDHIHYRARGGVWRYSMVKNMWKFDLNRGHDIEMRDNWGKKYKVPWTKLNLGASIQQGDFNHRGEQGMFESVGFRFFQLAGVAAPNSTFCTFRVIDDALEADASQFEGDFWGVYLAIEQENGRFMEEHDLPDGNLYKMEGGTGELNNLGPTGPTDKSDLTYLQANYTLASEQWWRTNWNLPRYYSYQAIVQGIHHYDIADGKNYFFYRNPQTRLWETCTWDLDLTWADNMYRAGQTGGGEPLKTRLLDDFANPGRLPNVNIEFRNRVREIRDLLWNSDQAFKLIDEYAALLRGPTNGPTILDADRSMWDYNPKMASSTYSENIGKAGQGRFYQWPNEPTVSKNFDGGVQALKNYVGYRATNATFSLDTMAADNLKPNRPTITYSGTPGFPINRLTFQSSAYSGVGGFQSLRWRLAEITDTNAPNYDPTEPQKYEIESVWESGPIPAFNPSIQLPANLVRVGSRYRARVLHTDATGRNSQWSLPQEFTVGPSDNLADLQNYLRITEVMYNPLPGGYEFIEIQNTSASITLDLAGVKFTQGIDYTFPSATLAPGAFLVVVGTPDIAGFRAYYGIGSEVAVFGPYTGSLNNAGEQLVLRTSAGGSDIVNFNYGDGRGWPVAADGGGHSMVFLEGALAAQSSGAGEYAGNWRGSTFLRGSPGAADAVPVPTILLNEVVAHTDFNNELDSNDWIELYNPTDLPITLGPGWYLSDSSSTYSNLMKWAIPTNTVIPAHGWVSFDEVTGFHFPTNTGFGLSKDGEQVFLSYLPGTAQDRVVDAVSFKGQENDWSIGRYPDGAPFWFGLTPRSRDAANAAPPARVTISELIYHPPDNVSGTNIFDNSLDEFVELHNGTPGPVTFHNTNGTWRMNGGVNFLFPTNLVLAADEYVLLVSFNPVFSVQSNTFRNLYGITNPNVRILGPYLGKLANNSDRLALEFPQHPDGTNAEVSWVIVDEVLYADQPPWPCGSDGTGNSLQRASATQHGTDPAQWAAEPPTAGRARGDLPAGLPTITSQPQSRVAATNSSASFSVSVCGTPPFGYQWLFNDGTIGNATNSTLNLVGLTPGNAGDYRVIVSNAAGSITSQVAVLIVQSAPFVTTHPQSITVISNQSANFSVTAGGTPPLAYQWQFNGVNISGATNDSLLLTNVKPAQAGNYRVQVINTAASAFSSNAVLTVQVPVYFSVQPTNQNVLPGTNVTLSSFAIGNGALRYQWRFEGTNILNATNATYSFTGANLTNHHGTYSVVVEDDISTAASSSAFIYVLVRPGIVIHIQPQTVLQGQNATFSLVATGAPPLGYRWIRNGGSLPGATTAVPVLVITNVQASGTIRVAVTNIALPSSGTGAFSPGPAAGNNVQLIMLADVDGDGMWDAWETNYFGTANTTNNPANALDDSDGDGMSNLDEYRSGTIPTDALSVLKIVLTATNENVLQFVAQTNLSYTVQSRSNLTGAAWINLTSITASALVRTVQLDAVTAPFEAERYFRVVTPMVP